MPFYGFETGFLFAFSGGLQPKERLRDIAAGGPNSKKCAPQLRLLVPEWSHRMPARRPAAALIHARMATMRNAHWTKNHPHSESKRSFHVR
jgi:hypothetical protein